jgi:hypothetical protein
MRQVLTFLTEMLLLATTIFARYKKPKGRLPSTATLTLKGGKLVWAQTRRSLGKGIPKQFVLRRAA